MQFDVISETENYVETLIRKAVWQIEYKGKHLDVIKRAFTWNFEITKKLYT